MKMIGILFALTTQKFEPHEFTQQKTKNWPAKPKPPTLIKIRNTAPHLFHITRSHHHPFQKILSYRHTLYLRYLLQQQQPQSQPLILNNSHLQYRTLFCLSATPPAP